MNGIQYVLRAGCAWRLIPHDLPHGQTVYQTFRAWRQDGTWLRIHDQLRDMHRTGMGRHPDGVWRSSGRPPRGHLATRV